MAVDFGLVRTCGMWHRLKNNLRCAAHPTSLRLKIHVSRLTKAVAIQYIQREQIVRSNTMAVRGCSLAGGHQTAHRVIHGECLAGLFVS